MFKVTVSYSSTTVLRIGWSFAENRRTLGLSNSNLVFLCIKQNIVSEHCVRSKHSTVLFFNIDSVGQRFALFPSLWFSRYLVDWSVLHAILRLQNLRCIVGKAKGDIREPQKLFKGKCPSSHGTGKVHQSTCHVRSCRYVP